jgi:hypothetical protein
MDSKQHLCNCYHILKVQMSKFNDKVSIQNVFTLIFEFCCCKNLFREKLVPQNSDIPNCCHILIKNERVQRENFGSERFYSGF